MIELADIIGQATAVEQLQKAISGDRMPHAFMFAGPAGVGRRTTAIALAKVLLCESAHEKKSPAACGKCDSCRMMDADSHPDFQLIYKELAKFHEDADVRSRVMQGLGIDVIRSFLLAPAGLASSQGRGKVFIVLESELMSIAAQNSMLKTLEEPPEGVRIILVCQKPEQMLPTTRSRCSIVRFGPLPKDFVTENLLAAGIGEAEANFWAVFTNGSIGRAISLAAQGMYEIKREVIAHLAEPGETELGEYLAKLTDKLAENAVKAAKAEDGSVLSKALATRRATGVMLELIAGAYRDAITLASGAGRDTIHSDQSRSIETLAERFAPIKLAEIIEQLSEYERLLWRNVNPKTIWDNAAITCTSATALWT